MLAATARSSKHSAPSCIVKWSSGFTRAYQYAMVARWRATSVSVM